MATYALRFLTRDGAVGSEVITNQAQARKTLEEWAPVPDRFAVVVLIVGGNFKERTVLGELAVCDVFFNRRDALRFVNKLVEELL